LKVKQANKKLKGQTGDSRMNLERANRTEGETNLLSSPGVARMGEVMRWYSDEKHW
jgi:hypothetical protein